MNRLKLPLYKDVEATGDTEEWPLTMSTTVVVCAQPSVFTVVAISVMFGTIVSLGSSSHSLIVDTLRL